MAIPLRIFLLSLVVFLAACANDHTAPVANDWSRLDTTQTEHHVQPGETIYSIAWRYNLSDQDLIRWNHLSAPYYVSIGQSIRLTPPPEQTGAVAAAPSFTPVESKAETPAPAPVGKGTWPWPLKGKILQSYGDGGNKGLDIAATEGTEIKAVQAGKVVYAGNSLRGYGNLVIVKQKDDVMAAYADAQKLLVHEGSQVTQGQVIGLSGTDGKQAMLHFEIRKAGKPVNPLEYLSS